jgi:hypothetical protein
MTFRVVPYSSPDAPPAYRWIAWIFVPAKMAQRDAEGNKMLDGKGTPVMVSGGEAALPIFFNGATKEAAVTRAAEFWHSEKAKDAAREAMVAERREKVRLAKRRESA